MIIVKGRELLIPNNERYIGTTYDTHSAERSFQIDRVCGDGVDISGLSFKLDIYYPEDRQVYNLSSSTTISDCLFFVSKLRFLKKKKVAGAYVFTYSNGWTLGGSAVELSEYGITIMEGTPENSDTITVVLATSTEHYDTVLLAKSVTDEKINLLWSVTEDQLAVAGTAFIQIRAINDDGEVRWSSFKADIYVEDNIDTPSHIGNLSELEELEKRTVEAVKIIEETGTSAQRYAELAEGYSESAQASADSASTSASNASTSETNASQSASEASASASNALTYKTGAESARDSAISAQEGAEDARDLAEEYAERAEHVADESIKFVPQTLTPAQQAIARENIGMAGDTQVSSFNGRSGAVVPMAGDYTKSMVGLGNVDNTSDMDKPVSTAQQTALDAKEDISNKTTSITGSSTDTEYPSAKAVYDFVEDEIPEIADNLTTDDDTKALSAKQGKALKALDDEKALKDTDAVSGNVAKFDASGNPIDSGYTASNILGLSYVVVSTWT